MSTVGETAVRFLLGGTVVSAFALIGCLFKPKSFAGLFGAAPSVGLGTLALAFAEKGAAYASLECRSMILGAVALGVYCFVVRRLIVGRRMRALPATLAAMLVWFAVAFGALGLSLGWLGAG